MQEVELQKGSEYLHEPVDVRHLAVLHSARDRVFIQVTDFIGNLRAHWDVVTNNHEPQLQVSFPRSLTEVGAANIGEEW